MAFDFRPVDTSDKWGSEARRLRAQSSPPLDSKTRVLITGIAGSGGSYLADYLVQCLSESVDVWGLVRWHSAGSLENLKGSLDRLRILECDLTDASSVLRSIDTARPDIIFHLASHANVHAGFETPLSVVHNNVTSTMNLLESLRILDVRPKFIMCSTSEVYGRVASSELPITEGQPLRPRSPYAASKTFQDLVSDVYQQWFGLPVVRTRMFTYINPRRRDLFATSFAQQIVNIERGEQSELRHGNLDSIRTLLDVRDAVRAYWMAATLGREGEVYNIGGTDSMRVGDFLDMLVAHAHVPIRRSLDPSLLRPADVTLQIPDTTKFRGHTGWAPEISTEESISFLLEHLRNS